MLPVESDVKQDLIWWEAAYDFASQMAFGLAQKQHAGVRSVKEQPLVCGWLEFDSFALRRLLSVVSCTAPSALSTGLGCQEASHVCINVKCPLYGNKL